MTLLDSELLGKTGYEMLFSDRNSGKLMDLSNNPNSLSWLIWTVILFAFCLFFMVIILVMRTNHLKTERRLTEDSFLYFKTVLSMNLLVMEVDISGLNEKYFSYQFPKNSNEAYIRQELSAEEINKLILRVHPSFSEELKEFVSFASLLDIAKSGKIAYKEIRVLDSLGKYIYASLTIQGIVNNDEVSRLFVLVGNIDESKKAEEEKRHTLTLALDTAKKFNDSRNIFLSQMSHDIRTPMNAIVGMTTIAQLNIEDRKKVEECLSTISNSSDHLLSLINDILDITSIESGRLSFNNSRIHLKETLENAVSMLMPRIHKSELKATLDMEKVVHDEVISDDTRLEQIFTNIISNAVKYTNPGGSIDISLSEEESRTPNTYFYKFVVKDTGIGMSEDMLSRIFKPFERAKEVSFMEGIGLGMAITKSIVDAMGGICQVESKIGEGTTVTISLYFADDADKGFENAKEMNEKKALVISPDAMNVDILSGIFAEEGIAFDVFPDVYSFEHFFEHEEVKPEYGFCITILMLPIPDEIEKLKYIRGILGDEPVLIDATVEDYSIVGDWTNDFVFDGFMGVPVYKRNLVRLVLNGFEARRKKTPSIEPTGNGRRCLIVEDVEINAMFAEAIVDMKGFVPEIAENGLIACEKLENSEDGYYSLVLMDIQMPVMNGYDATKRIRSSEREYLKNIPIIAMSANTFHEDILRCKEAGMNDHISKPVDISHFGAVVDTLIKG